MFGKFVLALVLATASATPFKAGKTKNGADQKRHSKLMKNARPTARSQLQRRANDVDYMPDISTYSLRFEQCQFVKAYDDEMADNEEAGTILATQRFVIFKLCPTDSDSCSYSYGEYIVDMETYLESYVEYAQEAQEAWCEACEEACEQDDGGRRKLDEEEEDDCACVETCYKIENMEDNGYIDATEFLECQNVYEDDYGNALFAGPYCSGGEKIKIGIFTDEECMTLDSSKDVEDYLQDGDGYSMKLSHALLKKTYDAEDPVDCLAVDDEERRKLNDQEAEIVEVCQALYEAAAKCEDAHGFDGGYEYYAEEYYNQLAQEDVVCTYISALKAGTYSEEGDIVVNGGNVVRGGGAPSGGQKFALTIFILGTVGFAVYAAMLHSQLTKGDKADLSKQGGAMA